MVGEVDEVVEYVLVVVCVGVDLEGVFVVVDVFGVLVLFDEEVIE